MKFLALTVAFLPTILGDAIGYDFKVNLLTTIPDLSMTSPSGNVISYNYASDRHEHDGLMVSVVGYMTFTETFVSQKQKVDFGQWTGEVGSILASGQG